MKKIIVILCLLTINVKSWAEELSVLFYVSDTLLLTKSRQTVEAEMDSWINQANSYYRDSLVDIRLKNVGTLFINTGAKPSADTILSNMTNGAGIFSNLFDEADYRGADYIYTVVNEFSNNNLCGQAIDVNRNDSDLTQTAKSVVTSRYDCSSDTMAHELGHVMGLAHGDQVGICMGGNHSSAIRTYARGWGVWDCDTNPNNNDEYQEFGDIMTGNYIWGRQVNNVYVHHTLTVNPKLQTFSNPAVTSSQCGRAGICGNASTGNAARALNEFKTSYSSHESPDVGFLTYKDAALKQCMQGSGYNRVEINNLEVLACTQKGIGSLEGIEQLTSLTNVDLRNNNISNLAPLIALAKIRFFDLNLSGNNTAQCHQVVELKQLLGSHFKAPTNCFNIGVMIAINSLLLR